MSEQDFLMELGTAGFKVVSKKVHDNPQSPGTLTLLAQWTPEIGGKLKTKIRLSYQFLNLFTLN